jgi:hypothetical protein
MHQKHRILEFLQDSHGKALTRLNSWEELGIIEAPARISELKDDGWLIKTEMVTITNKYGEKVRIAKWTLG